MRFSLLHLCFLLLMLVFGTESRALGKVSDGQKPHQGIYFRADLTGAGEEPSEVQDRIRETVARVYDSAPDVRDGPNLYAYVQQNPWSRFDPHGLNWLDTVKGAAKQGLGMLQGLAKLSSPNPMDKIKAGMAMRGQLLEGIERSGAEYTALREEGFNPLVAGLGTVGIEGSRITGAMNFIETDSGAKLDYTGGQLSATVFSSEAQMDEHRGAGAFNLVTMVTPAVPKFKVRTNVQELLAVVPESAFAAKGTLNTYGDALRGSLGPGRLSHADEWAATMSRAEGMGVTVVPRPGTMAYEPALGSPGRLLIDPDASIGALRHEFQHIVDDAALGHPGLRVMADSNQFWRLEFRGYMQEINTARGIRDFDAGRAILQEMRQRRMDILGR